VGSSGRLEPAVRKLLFVLSLLPLFGFQAKLPTHTKQTVEGWTVYVDDRLGDAANRVLETRALRVLADRLDTIKSRVAKDKVEWMQRHVPIWLDLTSGDERQPVYHPGAEWLKEHGYEPKMAKCVQIPRADVWVSDSFQMLQPLAILHELAHSYHDQVLSFDNKEVMAAYEKFKASGKYESVLRSNGRMERHYGLTNQMEFFAEMTESYFGANDFYPFNNCELKQAEPELFELMKKIWGGTPLGS